MTTGVNVTFEKSAAGSVAATCEVENHHTLKQIARGAGYLAVFSAIGLGAYYGAHAIFKSKAPDTKPKPAAANSAKPKAPAQKVFTDAFNGETIHCNENLTKYVVKARDSIWKIVVNYEKPLAGQVPSEVHATEDANKQVKAPDFTIVPDEELITFSSCSAPTPS